MIRLLTDDAYLSQLREQARRYRGPAPAELARAVGAAALDAETSATCTS